MILPSAFAAMMFTAACATASEPNYTLTVPADASLNGAMAYIINFDSGETTDSVMIADGVAAFKGNVETPFIGRVNLAGQRGPFLFVEPGAITVNEKGDATGTELNNRLSKLSELQQSLVAQFRALPEEERQAKGAAIQQQFQEAMSQFMDNNADNVAGLFMLLQEANQWDGDKIREMTAKYPILNTSKRIERYRDDIRKREETSPGHMYKDFEVTYNGETKRLSDYVGKGKYTLVDFWASWCGPCIRATKTLKELYGKYADKGLDFLGVAVWDEPDNTLDAIESHELPWPQIINAQTIPTDIYGIPGIPCIILFDPDGKIVSRDKQGEELVSDVDAAMATVLSE